MALLSSTVEHDLCEAEKVLADVNDRLACTLGFENANTMREDVCALCVHFVCICRHMHGMACRRRLGDNFG